MVLSGNVEGGTPEAKRCYNGPVESKEISQMADSEGSDACSIVGAVGGAIAGFLAVPQVILIAGTTYSLIGGFVASLALSVVLGGILGSRVHRR